MSENDQTNRPGRGQSKGEGPKGDQTPKKKEGEAPANKALKAIAALAGKARGQKAEAKQPQAAAKPKGESAPKAEEPGAKRPPSTRGEALIAPKEGQKHRPAQNRNSVKATVRQQAREENPTSSAQPPQTQRRRAPQRQPAKQKVPAQQPIMPAPSTSSRGKLKIIFLGGVEEIGKNITVLEFADDIVIVDCGSIFPKEDLLGIDLVIPDVSYLQRNREKIRGILVTHGHEDHIGAIPYVVKMLGGVVPIYASSLTLALIEMKLKEHRAAPNAALHVVAPGSHVNLGSTLQADFIRMTHSITGALAIAIRTPMGLVVATGDFKVDLTPVDGERMDLAKFASLGQDGVLALLMDSTNAERPGFTMSEKSVGETFDGLFPRAAGRIIIAMFASNVHRVQQVVDSAVKYGRKVCLTGRSMVNVSGIARQLGELRIPQGVLIDIDDLDDFADDEVVVITTGSQGEQMSGLTRMAFSEHRKLDIRQSDMVVLSAHPIPGNELSVSRVVDQLLRKGANVIYESLAEVHVSGHACQEELKLMHALLKPKFFIPVHGEYRMLSIHKSLAMAMGTPEENIYVPKLGDCLELSRDSMQLGAPVPAGAVLVDGLGVGDVGNVVLRDRKHLSQDGLIIVVVGIESTTKNIVSGPEIITRGFVYVRENEALVDEAQARAQSCIESCLAESERIDWSGLKSRLRDDMHDFLYQKTKRSPMILPVVLET
jgi:ribonuclease J